MTYRVFLALDRKAMREVSSFTDALLVVWQFPFREVLSVEVNLDQVGTLPAFSIRGTAPECSAALRQIERVLLQWESMEEVAT